MGACGQSQPGATSPPYLSQGLCPVMYNNAFEVDFNLVPETKIYKYFNVHCMLKKNTPDVTKLPNCTMGFRFIMGNGLICVFVCSCIHNKFRTFLIFFYRPTFSYFLSKSRKS